MKKNKNRNKIGRRRVQIRGKVWRHSRSLVHLLQILVRWSRWFMSKPTSFNTNPWSTPGNFETIYIYLLFYSFLFLHYWSCKKVCIRFLNSFVCFIFEPSYAFRQQSFICVMNILIIIHLRSLHGIYSWQDNHQTCQIWSTLLCKERDKQFRWRIGAATSGNRLERDINCH